MAQKMPISSKRLAIFLPDLVVGGAERSMIKLAGGIAARGYPVDFVLASARGPFLNEVPDSVHLVDLGAKRVLTSLPALVRYFRHVKPTTMLSVMHANFVALWARCLARVPTRVIVSERNTLSREASNSRNDIRMSLMPLLVRSFYPWADRIVAVSTGVAEDLTQVSNIPSEQIKVIYNPIVTPEFKEKTRMPLRHPWFMPGEPPVVLAVGRLSAQKGFEILIQAFSIVRQACAARLLILGDGEERFNLERLVKKLNLEMDVSLPGYVANPYPYMIHANVFVLSSRWEGLPGVLIEALYCGSRIVSTDCPSGACEILDNGKYGRLVPVGDIDAMRQAIIAALNDEIPCPPDESWHRFELETIVDQYIHVLFEN